MAKVHDNATDLVTFARSSSGTALRRVGYGDELVDNGDFATTDISAWDSFDGTLAVVGGQLELTYTNATQYVWVEVTTTPGTLYEFSIDCRSDNAVGHKLVAWSEAFPLGTQIAINPSFVNFSASLTTQTLGVRATTSTTLFMVATQLTSGTAYFDNISVKEVIFDRATDPLVLFNHPDDIPRIEYGSDGSLKGLLIEEQRTNLITHSDFSGGWAGQTQASPSINSVTSPTGQQDAMVVTSSGADPYFFDFNSVSSGNDYTFTVWLKGVGNTIGRSPKVRMLPNSGTVSSVVVDTTPLTSEWRRYTSTGTCTASGSILTRIDFDDTGLSASGEQVYAFGAQLEEGSFATSYIPTSGSQETRWADVASIPVSAFGYNQTAGTVVVEATPIVLNSGNLLNLNTSGSDATSIYANPNTSGHLVVRNTTTQVNLDAGSFASGQASKLGLAIKENDFAVCLDAGTVASDNSGTLPSPIATMAIGSTAPHTGFCNSHIKSLKYYPRRLTNAQLQELTA